jgi:hypothetical protein
MYSPDSLQSIKEMESAFHRTTLQQIQSTSFKLLIYHIWVPAIHYHKTYHKLPYLSIDTSDCAKLGEVLQHMTDLDWAKLDWNELVLMAVRFGKADMLGEVLQRMPDVTTGKKTLKY